VGVFPRIAPATWANEAPLETVVNRSAPMACRPNVDQARRSRGQRRSASRTLPGKADPRRLPPTSGSRPATALVGGALAGSGPGTSPCIDGLPRPGPWDPQRPAGSNPCARRWLRKSAWRDAATIGDGRERGCRCTWTGTTCRPSLPRTWRGHVRDLEVQNRYGARYLSYLSYWFDYDRQTAFCLVGAPSKAVAEAVHRAAHGLIASRMI
jgi:Protein of unknown function (DUF4242)